MKTDKLYFFSGKMLKELRRRKAITEKRKINQHIFASEINRPYGTIATWESKGIPKIEDAVIVAEYYGVPIPEVASGVKDYHSMPESDPAQEQDMPFISSAASAIIEALNKVIETKDQIIAEKERLIREKDRVIELIREQLDRMAH